MINLEKFRKAYAEDGLSYKDLATQFNVSFSTITRWVTKFGLKHERRKEFKDLIGAVFGKLKVLEYVRTGRYQKGGTFRIWKCRCECGGLAYAREGNLRHKNQTTCKVCSLHKLVASKEQKCCIDYNVWYSLYKRAKERNIPCEVTPEYLYQLFLEQNGRCALSGVEIFFGKKRKDESTASPDRIIPEDGYVVGNVRWVHKYVNSMRNNKTTDEFLDWCKKIVNHNNSIQKDRQDLGS